MKSTKIFLFILLTFLFISINSASATDVSGGVTVTVTAPVSCVGSWSTCSGGSHTFTISTPASDGGVACSPAVNTTESCGTNGGWSTWSSWGACSVTACGQTGTQTQTRTCTNPSPSGGGKDCSSLDGGNATKSQSCSTAACPAGSISASNCSISQDNNSCNSSVSWNTANHFGNSAVTTPDNITVATAISSNGTSYPVDYGSRTFYLYNNGSLLGQSTATASCAVGLTWNNGYCRKIIDGGWSTWSSWGACSVTACGQTGTQTQTRTCTNPSPSGGGKDCSSLDGGNATKSQSCSTAACPPSNCSSPLTQTVTVQCDTKSGFTYKSGSVTRSQTKSDYPGCTFGSPVTVDNSTYVSDNCVYTEIPTGTWSYPSACPLDCGLTSSTQTQTCTGGNGSCSGTALTRTCPGTAICPPDVCPSPLSQTVTVQCDLKNGVAATSGLVTRSQTKSDYPQCTFGSPVTVDNSTYVSDNCVYPIVETCEAPLTQTVTVQCDINSNQDAAISGLVTRSQTKSAYPQCTFGSPVTVSNSTYVSDDCVYPAIVGERIDGVWSMWDPTRSDICGASGTQTRTCVYPNPSNKGAYCPSDADGLALTKDYINTDCPVVTPPVVTVVIPPKPVDPLAPVDPLNPVDPSNPSNPSDPSNPSNPSSSGGSKVVVDGGKIPYNGKITMTWEQQNIASCTCTYIDSTGKKVDCPNFNGTPYSPPALKKATLFTLSCLGKIWGSVTVTKEVLVNDINTNYTEN